MQVIIKLDGTAHLHILDSLFGILDHNPVIFKTRSHAFASSNA